MQAQRIVQEFGQAFPAIDRVVVEIDLVAHVPVTPDADPAVLHRQCVAGKELLHALEQGLLADGELKGQVFGQRAGVGGDLRQKRQQGLGLRGEDEMIADDRVVERLDAEAVAGAEQAPFPFVPDGKGEHAAQVPDAFVAVAVVGGENRLGVRCGAEPPAVAEGLAQFQVVVDLAVVDDGRAVRPPHRLAGRFAQVDDGKAPMGEADIAPRGRPSAFTVAAAMGHEFAHRGEAARHLYDLTPAKTRDASNAAH